MASQTLGCHGHQSSKQDRTTHARNVRRGGDTGARLHAAPRTGRGPLATGLLSFAGVPAPGHQDARERLDTGRAAPVTASQLECARLEGGKEQAPARQGECLKGRSGGSDGGCNGLGEKVESKKRKTKTPLHTLSFFVFDWRTDKKEVACSTESIMAVVLGDGWQERRRNAGCEVAHPSFPKREEPTEAK